MRWCPDSYDSTYLGFRCSYSSSCNWERTLAAKPREILRSIRRLQTHSKRGGLAGFEVKRRCKSLSSGFVLMPLKASISVSSPVLAWVVRCAVLVIGQRQSLFRSGTSCHGFANLVSIPDQLFQVPVTPLLLQLPRCLFLILSFSLLFCNFFKGIRGPVHLM